MTAVQPTQAPTTEGAGESGVDTRAPVSPADQAAIPEQRRGGAPSLPADAPASRRLRAWTRRAAAPLREGWRRSLDTVPVRWQPVVAATVFAAVLHVLWLWLIANGGGDLAAQDAWAEFAGRHPGSAYNLAWYGGMHPVSYSVISPYLMAVLGVRTTLILSGVLSAAVLALILARSGAVRRPMAPALWGAFSFACNAASGRVTFALGTLFALGAVAAVWSWPARWRHRRKLRGATVALLSALATAGSPVAGLFLWVVAAALLLNRRRAMGLAIALPPPVVVGLSVLLFPFQGVQPMPLVSVLFPLAAVVGVRWLAPPAWRTVRRSCEVYGLGILLTWAIPSQVGSNVERLSLLFGGVALLALVPLVARGTRRFTVLVVAFVVVAGWQIGKPTYDVIATKPDAAWAHQLAPLIHQLKNIDAERGRVEVVPVRSHREASALMPYVNLARGWNRQADTDRNPLFYEEGGLTPTSYHDWLRRWAVRYVVLPTDEDPDPAARDEARLVRSGLPYLKPVWSDANWRLYRVADPLPLAAPPAQGARAEAGGLTVKVQHPGAVLVRVPWSPWLGLVDADGSSIKPPRTRSANRHGCLRPADPEPVTKQPATGEDDDEEPPVDRWTMLQAPHAGTYRIAAPYELPRGTPCPDPHTPRTQD